MTKQIKFPDDDPILMDKYDLRVTRIFWATIGFLLGAGLGLIIAIEKCDFFFVY